MKRIVLILLALLTTVPALAAPQKPLVFKNGVIRSLPVGDVLTLPAPTTGAASINLPHGTAPTAPSNGDCWTTTSGMSCRVNGATVGPYAGTATANTWSAVQTATGVTLNTAGSVALTSGGNTPSLKVGASLYPTNVGGTYPKYDATSNVLTNVIGAQNGLFGAAAKDGTTWVDTYLPGVDVNSYRANQIYSISTNGFTGGFFASRSSDNPVPGTNVIGSINLSVCNSATSYNCWGAYSAAYFTAGATSSFVAAHEFTTASKRGAAPVVAPANINPSNVVNALRVTCGDGTGNWLSSCSNAFTVAFNDAAWNSGILFQQGSLASSSGYSEAIAMPTGYGTSWYGTAGTVPTWRLFANGTNLGYTNSIILGDNTVDFYVSGGGKHPLQLVPNGTVVTGVEQLLATTFSALPTCNSGQAGSMAYINDASAAITVWHQAVTAGGGANKAFITCNGVSWNAYSY